MFHGGIVALVTPMHMDGEIDYIALERLVAWHLDQQIDGFVILGSTGEAATIETDERAEIVRQVITQVKSRVPVIVGTGTNSTHHTIQLTRQAMALGADAVLLVVPYYVRPTQEGLYQHFKAISESVPIPQILYNVPIRTACDLLPETVCRIAEFSNVIGIKEATGDVSRVAQLKDCGLDLFSGDDKTALDFILAGGRGVISVVANVVPNAIHLMCKAALDGDREQAKDIDHRLNPLYTQMSIESNPIPVKWGLVEMGMIDRGIRLPLTPLSQPYRTQVRTALEEFGAYLP